jgi:hypothetical protein
VGPCLALVEVVALAHLDAVKDMVTRIQHLLAIFIDESAPWSDNIEGKGYNAEAPVSP